MTAIHLLVRANVGRSVPLADRSVQCVVTSPPYFGLRDYGEPGQLGLEPTPDAYVASMVRVFREVRRALKDDGVLWLNIGDSYANWVGPARTKGHFDKHDTCVGSKVPRGFKEKDRLGIPHRVVFALQRDGWYWRDEIVWHKPSPMPESVTDRTTKAHEMVFLLTKRDRYFYDAEAIKEASSYADCGRPSKVKGEFQAKGEPLPGQLPFRAITETRNARSVWTIATTPYPGAHFATMPPKLAERCILAGSRPGDIVYDPFNGSGTTGSVATGLGRHYVGSDLNAAYLAMAERRISRPHAKVTSVGDKDESLPLFATADPALR